jgi:hypothetical protein
MRNTTGNITEDKCNPYRISGGCAAECVRRPIHATRTVIQQCCSIYLRLGRGWVPLKVGKGNDSLKSEQEQISDFDTDLDGAFKLPDSAFPQYIIVRRLPLT